MSSRRFTLSGRWVSASLGLLASGAIVLAAMSARSAPPASSSAPASSGTPAASGTAATSAAPATSGTVAPSGTAAASAAPAASGTGRAPLPLLRGADIPETPSDPVKDPSEWRGAKNVRPTVDGKAPCRYHVLRDWLSIECVNRIGAGLFAGDPKDVKIWVTGDPASEDATTNIVMRLARGEAKSFALIQLDRGYDGSWVGSAETLSIGWSPSKPDPVIFSQ